MYKVIIYLLWFLVGVLIFNYINTKYNYFTIGAGIKFDKYLDKEILLINKDNKIEGKNILDYFVFFKNYLFDITNIFPTFNGIDYEYARVYEGQLRDIYG